MGNAIATWSNIVIAAIIAVPICAIGALAIASWRIKHGVNRATAYRYSLCDMAIVAGTWPWILMTLTPVDGMRDIHVIPFEDLRLILTGSPGYIGVQIIGNLIIFAAFGFIGPIRYRLSLIEVTLIAFAGSMTIETTQYALDIGRITSIDDVMLNTVGASIAACLSMPWWRQRNHHTLIEQQ